MSLTERVDPYDRPDPEQHLYTELQVVANMRSQRGLNYVEQLGFLTEVALALPEEKRMDYVLGEFQYEQVQRHVSRL